MLLLDSSTPRPLDSLADSHQPVYSRCPLESCVLSDAVAEQAAAELPRRRARTIYRVVLVLALLLILAVLVAVPLALNSMGSQIADRQAATLYDFPSGLPISVNSTAISEDTQNFIKIAAIDIDEGTGSITLAISGHRLCKTTCPAVTFTVVSLEDDATVRRAFPPSAELTLQPNDVTFSDTVQLPIHGQPIQYPFDDWDLWLGLAGTQVAPDGSKVPLTAERFVKQFVITTQNQLRDFLMGQPTAIDPSRVRSPADPYDFMGVQSMHFERPLYLKILAILLILLIAISAIMAVFMRNMIDVVVGVGSLVIGIWGVRSILVPQPIPVITSIDLALSLVILFVLLGLAVRVVSYFHRLSELPPVKRPSPLTRRTHRKPEPGE